MAEQSEALRTAYLSGQYDDAVAMYRSMTARTPEDFFYGGMALRNKCDLSSARWALELGLDAKPAQHLRLQLLLMHGITCREIGDFSVSVKELESFISEVDSEPSLLPVTLGLAYYNIGLAYRQVRRYADAVTAYRLAIMEFRKENMPRFHLKALHNVAWAQCMAGDALSAENVLNDSEALCASTDDSHHQRLGRAYVAFVAGRHLATHKHCQDLMKDEEASAQILSHAHWLLGHVALASDRVDKADEHAEQAIELARRVTDGESRCLLDAIELLDAVTKRRRKDEAGNGGTPVAGTGADD